MEPLQHRGAIAELVLGKGKALFKEFFVLLKPSSWADVLGLTTPPARQQNAADAPLCAVIVAMVLEHAASFHYRIMLELCEKYPWKLFLMLAGDPNAPSASRSNSALGILLRFTSCHSSCSSETCN